MAKRGPVANLVSFLPQAAVLGIARALPYRQRSDFGGWLGQSIVRRVPKLRRRVEANLSHVMPELSQDARTLILRETGDTFGRTFMELLNNRAFHEKRAWRPPTGPGPEIFLEAARAGRGPVVVTGHFGQYEATRAWMKAQGINCCGVYRPTDNPHLNQIYLRNMEEGGAPMYAKGPKGIRGIVGQLAKGGTIGILTDQFERRGRKFDFLGRPAPTSTIAAELALKYDVPMIPVYGIRDADGIHVDVVIETPIPPSDVATMTQAMNDSLAAQVRAHPGQYYWLHRRWEKDLPGISG